MYQPLSSTSNATNTIISILTPNGVLHQSAQAGSAATSSTSDDSACNKGMLGSTSCWNKDLTGMVTQFKGYQSIVEKFAGEKNYGTEFTPIQFKSQVVNGVIYTIQYKIAGNKTIQATIYVPAVVKSGSTSV